MYLIDDGELESEFGLLNPFSLSLYLGISIWALSVKNLCYNIPIAGRRAGKHDVVSAGPTRPTRLWIVVRRPKVMTNLVGKGQLGHFGWHAGVVVNKRDDTWK